VTFPSSEVQGLSPGAEVELFDLDCTALGDTTYHFHSGQNETLGNVVFGGVTYTAFPIVGSGWEITTQGTLPRPKLQVSNLDETVSALIKGLADLVGARVVRTLTLVKFLDAVNFAGGVNPTADQTAKLRSDIFVISQKTAETRDTIEFQLESPMDAEGLRLPGRTVQATICTWVYRQNDESSACTYTGGPVAMADDTPTTDPALDACSHRLSGCKLRFGANGDLPFGGFPGAGLT